MFVRTKEGKILKCFKGESMNLPIYYVIGSKTNGYIEYQDVKKTSENIIDILEVGDYVNGYKVINTGTEELGHKFITLDFNIDCDELHWGECTEIENSIDIKSIVTKEQFEAIKYEIK